MNAEYYQGGKEISNTRKTAGTVMEVGGAGIGILELLSLDLGGALAGGLLFLIGKWTKNYGKDGK